MLNNLLLQRPLFLGVLIKRKIPPSFQLAISFIVLLLTPVVFADLNEFSSLPSKTPPLKTLEEMLATPGIYNFRVIVELDIDAVSPSSSTSTRAGVRSISSLEEQSAEVAAVQEMFLDSLTTGMITPAGNMNPTKFTFVGAIAMTVDKFTLSRIKQNSLVTKVVLDQAVPLALAESIPLIRANKVWQKGYTGTGQTVAIIDSGIDGTHPALAGKVVAEACFSTTNPAVGSSSLCPNGLEEEIGTGSAVPCEGIIGCEHGTHVAGIATANGALKGVAPEANIIAIQVSSRFDNDTYCGVGNSPCQLIYFSDVIRALEHVLSLRHQGMAIASANLSLGGGSFYFSCDDELPSLTEVIDNLRQLGVATVVASGNGWDGYSMGLPACISSAISVGATCDIDNLGNDPDYDWFCPNGKDSVGDFSSSAYFLNLLAPGMWITSTIPGNALGTMGGTSMAAPFVSGAWALLKSIKPNATVEEILTILQDTGKPILDKRNNFTKSRIQLDAAVQAMVIEEPPPPVEEPPSPPVDEPPPPVDEPPPPPVDEPPPPPVDEPPPPPVEEPPSPPVEEPPSPPVEEPPLPPDDPQTPPLATILPNLSVVSDEQGFHFMWTQAAELDSGGGMNLWCAGMDKDNHTFKDLTKVNQQLAAAIDEAFYPSGGINGVKYCALEEINAAGESTFHCDAAVVISDEISVNITDLEAAIALCHNLTQ